MSLIFLLLISISLYIMIFLAGMFFPANPDYLPAESGIPIYIVNNGVHLDLALPLKTVAHDWSDMLSSPLDTGADTLGYILIGWGDEGFYKATPTWDDIHIGITLKALFLPTPAAIHVMHLDRAPEQDKDVIRRLLSIEEYTIMCREIQGYFQVDDKGNAMGFEGYNPPQDRFYKAKGTYHLFYTCNSWTNSILKKTGIKTASWAAFTWDVMYHL